MADVFWSSNSPPPSLEASSELARTMVAQALSEKRRIALVTSGGTTVPLEKNTVRYLDNFSSGTRGSVTAELLLEAGYCVIFLHRPRSLQPYVRCIQHDALLHSFEADGPDSIRLSGNSEVATAIANLHRNKNRLVQISFVSVHDYLYLFRALCQALQPAGVYAMVYACAAVSDFYIPESKMTQHKIQSRGPENGLVLSLDPVPKLLGTMNEYCSLALKITFKLETDESILDAKASASLQSYGQDVVVGNLLHSHRTRVKLYFRRPETLSRVVEKLDSVALIEHEFVQQLIQYHKEAIEN